MSREIYFGFEKNLLKTDINSKEIFNPPKEYEKNLWFLKDIFFEEDISERIILKLPNRYKKYKWYQFQSMLKPFNVNKKIKIDMPDYYEASRQLTNWLKNFIIKNSLNQHIVMLVIWNNNKDFNKLEEIEIDLNQVDCDECSLPKDWTISSFKY